MSFNNLVNSIQLFKNVVSSMEFQFLLVRFGFQLIYLHLNLISLHSFSEILHNILN